VGYELGNAVDPADPAYRAAAVRLLRKSAETFAVWIYLYQKKLDRIGGIPTLDPSVSDFRDINMNPLTVFDHGTFMDLVVETNRRRYGRDGTAYPGTRYSRSVLRYGNGNPQDPAFDSLAEWYADAATRSIYVRIPWGKLLVTDPSGRSAWFGFDGGLNVRTAATSGVELSVYALKPTAGPDNLSAMEVAMSLPVGAAPQALTWKGWDTVKPESYFKKSYFAMQKQFLEEQHGEQTAPGPRTPGLRAVGSGAQPGSPAGR